MGFRKRGGVSERVSMSDYWCAVGEQPAGQQKHLDLSKLCKKERKGSVQGSTALNQENSRLLQNVQTHSVASLVESRGKLWRKSNLKDQRYEEHFTRNNTHKILLRYSLLLIIKGNVNYNNLEDILYL